MCLISYQKRDASIRYVNNAIPKNIGYCIIFYLIDINYPNSWSYRSLK
nr:MAG TPA: hypothetical protein [Caudoviricetes sp.]